MEKLRKLKEPLEVVFLIVGILLAPLVMLLCASGRWPLHVLPFYAVWYITYHMVYMSGLPDKARDQRFVEITTHLIELTFMLGAIVMLTLILVTDIQQYKGAYLGWFMVACFIGRIIVYQKQGYDIHCLWWNTPSKHFFSKEQLLVLLHYVVWALQLIVLHGILEFIFTVHSRKTLHEWYFQGGLAYGPFSLKVLVVFLWVSSTGLLHKYKQRVDMKTYLQGNYYVYVFILDSFGVLILSYCFHLGIGKIGWYTWIMSLFMYLSAMRGLSFEVAMATFAGKGADGATPRPVIK